jgi:hypothetical protein
VGLAAVRAAVQNAVQNAGIPYVGTVYPSRPTLLQEEDYDQTLSGQAVEESANGSACVVVVNLPGPSKRMQRALAGRGNVNDTNVHPVALELFFASTSGDALAAQADYDTIVDELFVLIRNNPTLSAPAAVWSAGEFTAGVTHSQSVPYSSADGLTALIAGIVRFEAWEWISGTGV